MIIVLVLFIIHGATLNMWIQSFYTIHFVFPGWIFQEWLQRDDKIKSGRSRGSRYGWRSNHNRIKKYSFTLLSSATRPCIADFFFSLAFCRISDAHIVDWLKKKTFTMSDIIPSFTHFLLNDEVHSQNSTGGHKITWRHQSFTLFYFKEISYVVL